ncbi:hypothetical protein [Methylovorus mays]|uniref:hypothetical protein n=1 Tax=Methylovorus mays TaxID=184077 RepID=UPI001E34FAE9|nr:hypothetical protein [Methylovorus mays]MCB5207275.1 hypothetical protein [Methylovorus mays]
MLSSLLSSRRLLTLQGPALDKILPDGLEHVRLRSPTTRLYAKPYPAMFDVSTFPSFPVYASEFMS